MKAMPDSADSLVFECDIDEPPEKVWRALTEPRLLEAWLATDHCRRTDSPREAAAPTLPPPTMKPGERSHRVDGKTGLDGRTGPAGSTDYEIMTAEPNRRVRYRWRDREGGVGDSSGREVHSVVTVELVPCTTGGTHLRLTHGEFRIVAMAPSVTAARVSSITSARRLRTRTPNLCLAVQTSWRRAA
ncbi:MAG TPA: SRPBCC domain-containing protein [Steroidobacteraceae bacterium]|nr:SRPBCC domain-containing protein [Steroidobacteraceae bacterium]